MLSVVVITKNEEDVIADCIDSIRDIAQEIIVIDSKSNDRTTDIARQNGAKVYEHEFKDFSDQRNFAFSKATNPWILCLDADERATKEFNQELIETLRNFNEEGDIGGYFIKRKTFYFGRDWGFEDRVQRVFFKKRFKKWVGVVHETPKIIGEFGLLESPVLHFTHSDLTRMLEKTNAWSEYEAELRYTSHHPKMNTLRFLRVMLTAFFNSYIMQKGYKNGTEGLIEAMYQSFSIFVTYAKLWEKQIGK